MNTREREQLTALKSRTDWEVFRDVYTLPSPLNISPVLLDQVKHWEVFEGYGSDAGVIRSMAGMVRQKLFPAWLARRATCPVVPLQLDFTPKTVNGSRPPSWHFIGAPGAYYLLETPVFAYEDYHLPLSNGVAWDDDVVEGPPMANEYGEALCNYYCHTNNHRALYCPAFDRGLAPPIAVDHLKTELAEMVASGTDIMLTFFVSGPDVNIRLVVPDFDVADREHLDRIIGEVSRWADRIVKVAEVWFRDDDGVAMWDGVQITVMSKDQDVVEYIAPFEGRSLGEWQESRIATRRTRRVGRNDLCPCGSGEKYKKCCMRTNNGTN